MSTDQRENLSIKHLCSGQTACSLLQQITEGRLRRRQGGKDMHRVHKPDCWNKNLTSLTVLNPP